MPFHFASTSARNLLLASVLAVAALGGPAMQAHAYDDVCKDKPASCRGGDNLCSIQTGPGDFDFYLVGEEITINGHTFRCRQGGVWVEERPVPTQRLPRPAATRE